MRRAGLVEGMSVREASRVFGLHRDTVRKMLTYSAPPGYRRESPRRVADNANFLRAGRLLLSSRYWTEPIRLLANAAEQLLDLRNEVVSWLINRHHNRRKRAVAAQCLDSLMVELAGGPKVPVSDEDTGDRNNAMKAMEEAVAVVRDIATTEWPDASASRSLGGRCRNVVDRLMEPRQDNLPSLSTVGDPVPEALVEMLSLLAEMLIARAEQRSIAPDISRRAGSESWVDVSRRCMDAVASAGYQAEREALEDALGTYASSCAIHRVEHADLNSAQFLTDKWVLVVSPDGDLPDFLSLLDRLGPAMALQLASRAAALFRLRHEAGLDVDRAAFESRLASARSAAELCHPML